MDEKELVKRVRNSFGAKKSRAEILSGFQKRGYKLAYAEKLIEKARRPKKILGIFAACLIVLLSVGFLFYTSFSNGEKMQIPNPLSGFTITGNAISTTPSPQVEAQPTTYDQIEITPEFISYLLNEIGAWELHKNPLTLENPIVNFKIDDETFHSEIGDKIETNEGLSEIADLEFIISKEDLIDAILSNDPEDIFKKSVVAGRTQIELKVAETELFAKGYLGLYEGIL